MPLTGVAASIAPLRKTVAIKINGGGYVGTEWVATAATDGTSLLAPLPITGKDLKVLEAGKYTIEDVKFYQIIGDGDPLKSGDLIEYKSLWREVGKIMDRADDGGFMIYFTKVPPK